MRYYDQENKALEEKLMAEIDERLSSKNRPVLEPQNTPCSFMNALYEMEIFLLTLENRKKAGKK